MDQVKESFALQRLKAISQCRFPRAIQSPEITICVGDTEQVEGETEEAIQFICFVP